MKTVSEDRVVWAAAYGAAFANECSRLSENTKGQNPEAWQEEDEIAFNYRKTISGKANQVANAALYGFHENLQGGKNERE